MALEEYEVVGNHPVHGHAPGSTFKAELDSWAKRVLIEAGHLRVVEKTSKEKTDEE